MNLLKLLYDISTVGNGFLTVLTTAGAVVTFIGAFMKSKYKAALISLAIALTLAALGLIRGYSLVEVPDVTGYYFEDARKILIENNLKYSGTMTNDSIVASQTPDAGEIVFPRSIVTLSTTDIEIDVEIGLEMPEIGDIISFGRYEQDNNSSNGAEPIEWIVLDTQKDGQALLISKMALDCQPFNTDKTAVSWETSSIRQWLNGIFYNAAFNIAEQEQIITTMVTADNNPIYNTSPGSNTNDKLFLLSLEEVNKYIPEDSKKVCNATQYAVKQGAYVNPNNGGSWWWLRSPGITNCDAASINSDGSVDYDDGSVNSGKGTIRPAMWIKIKG